MSRERGSAVGGVIQVNQLRLHSHVFTSEQKQTDIDTAAVFHFGVLYIGNFFNNSVQLLLFNLPQRKRHDGGTDTS